MDTPGSVAKIIKPQVKRHFQTFLKKVLTWGLYKRNVFITDRATAHWTGFALVAIDP